MAESNKVYLGDGVYASYDGYYINLAVNRNTNQVVALGPEVIVNFQQFIEVVNRFEQYKLGVTLADSKLREVKEADDSERDAEIDYRGSSSIPEEVEEVDVKAKLTSILNEYPDLIYDNNGYEYLKKEVRDRLKPQINEIEELLSKSIEGFVEFNNFKPRPDGTFDVRCQYKWDYRFTGVGYFPINDF